MEMKFIFFFVWIICIVILGVSARGGGTNHGVEAAPLSLFQRAKRHAPIMANNEPEAPKEANEEPPPPPKFRSRRNVMEVANDQPPPPPKQFRERRQAPPGMPPPPEGMPPPPEGMPPPPMLW